MGVSKNRGFPPKSSILIGFSIIFTIHFGVPLFLETPKYLVNCLEWENEKTKSLLSQAGVFLGTYETVSHVPEIPVSLHWYALPFPEDSRQATFEQYPQLVATRQLQFSGLGFRQKSSPIEQR